MRNLGVTEINWKLYLSDPDQGGKTGGLYCGKYPLYDCFASFVQLKIMHNYVTFRIVFKLAFTHNT
jgi:hypothetical protein